MREIKFRARDTYDEDMVYDIDNARADTGYTTLNEFFRDDRWQFMQFTGLLDKDGKEIYEGDILGRNHLGEMQVEGVIVYDKDLSRIVFNQVNGAFEEINKAELNLLEVIGNIHENPELINR